MRDTVRRTGLRAVILGVAAALAVTGLSGCGFGGGTPAKASSESSQPNVRQLWVQYAQCLRSHGFDEPDPTFDDVGQIQWQVSLDKAPPQVTAACDSVRQRAFNPEGKAPSAAQLTALSNFAQCMRGHGIADFPDPNPKDGTFMLNKQQHPDLDPQLATFHAATGACRKLAGAAG